MTILKTVIVALSLCLLVTSTSFASITPTTPPVTSISKSLRTELSTMVQNPQLAKHNLNSASVDVLFSIDLSGEITILKSNSACPYLVEFVQEKVNGQQLDSVNYTPDTNYQVRFSFKLQ
ncbi:MAG: hypothetical protein ACI8YQ_001078 [Polaribacter sp.]|jgi:hypothetical protein